MGVIPERPLIVEDDAALRKMTEVGLDGAAVGEQFRREVLDACAAGYTLAEAKELLVTKYADGARLLAEAIRRSMPTTEQVVANLIAARKTGLPLLRKEE